MTPTPLRPLGDTGLAVSPLTLGTVKWGRNRGLKFPAFELPDDRALHALLDAAFEVGINLLDTAPAYGVSEERIGKLLAERGPAGGEFLIATKAGETFEDGASRFDFSAAAIRASAERSLRRLRRETLDILMVHSAPDDLSVLRDTPAPEVLDELKSEGKVRATGFSTMSPDGGLLAAERCDVLMVPYNLHYQVHRPVIDRAAELGRGVIVKRGLFSGRPDGAATPLAELVRAVFAVPGVSSLAVGTTSADHLRENAAAAG